MRKSLSLAAVVVLGFASAAYADLSSTSAVAVTSTTGGVSSSGVSGAGLTSIDGVTGLTLNNPGVAGTATVQFLLSVPAGPGGETTFVLFATAASGVTLTSLEVGTGGTGAFTSLSTAAPAPALLLAPGVNRFVGSYAGDVSTYTTFRAVFTVASGGTLSVDKISNPEPGTIALFGAGILGLGGFAWRRRKTLAAKKS